MPASTHSIAPTGFDRSAATPRLWIDVEDLFVYARANARPSGIQRLAYELYRDLQARRETAGMVGFVRHDNPRNSFQTVSWDEIAALCEGLANDDAQQPDRQAPERDGGIRPHPPARQALRRFAYRLPPAVRLPFIDLALACQALIRAGGRLVAACSRLALTSVARTARKALGRRERTSRASNAAEDFASLSKPGDILLAAGAPWGHPDYGGLVQIQRRRGLRFAILFYDLIPLRRPEWCERGLVRGFTAWLDGVLPVCDYPFAISRATANDVEAYMRAHGLPLARPVMVVPIGDSFGGPEAARDAPATRALPPPGTYALAVSTIEARKNHVLLFRVWRRLLEEIPLADVPTLVFAGRVGWLVADLMQQIANTANLNGKLIVIESPTDAEIAALYRGCLFTLFPSFFEGWGLPVAESLAFGKPCITSDRTSLAEVGGTLTRRFDPDNLSEAYAVIRAIIADRPGLARWEEQIRREYRPTPWSATSDALLEGLGLREAKALPVECSRGRSASASAAVTS